VWKNKPNTIKFIRAEGSKREQKINGYSFVDYARNPHLLTHSKVGFTSVKELLMGETKERRN